MQHSKSKAEILARIAVKQLLNADEAPAIDLEPLDEYRNLIQKLIVAHENEGPRGVKNMLRADKNLSDFADLDNERIELLSPREVEQLESPRMLNKWLVEGGLNVVVGASGIGKSMAVLRMVVPIAEERNVLYICTEGLSGLKPRINALCQHKKLQHDSLRYKVVPRSINLTNHDSVLAVLGQVVTDQWQPAVVVIDTMSRCFWDGSENNSQDVMNFVRNVQLIQDVLGCTIVLVHHTTKNSDQARGSNALEGAADSVILVKKSDRQPFCTTIQHSKLKDGKPQSAVSVSFITVTLPDDYEAVLVNWDDPLEGNEEAAEEVAQVGHTRVDQPVPLQVPRLADHSNNHSENGAVVVTGG